MYSPDAPIETNVLLTGLPPLNNVLNNTDGAAAIK
jgi:hypothetical protein